MMNFYKRIIQKLLVISALIAGTKVQAQYYVSISNPFAQYKCNGNYGNGLSFYDFNNDGLDDLSLLSDSLQPIFLLNNQGEFQSISLEGIDVPGQCRSLCWVDFNNDSHPDLCFLGTGPGIRLYLNNGNLQFTDITASAGIQQLNCNGYGQSWGDYDLDGDLDVYFCNYENALSSSECVNRLYKNNGNNTFSDVSVQAGVDNGLQLSFLSIWIDYDRDGDPDLYVENDRTAFYNYLYRNNGDGTFTNVAPEAGVHENFEPMSGTIGDYNHDGYPDLYVTDGVQNRFYRNNTDGTFTDVAGMFNLQMAKACWGAVFTDTDLDGEQDLVVATAVPMPIYEHLHYFKNTGTAFEANLGVGFQNTYAQSYAIAIGDVNDDGKQDIMSHNLAPEGGRLYLNSTETGNYLKLKVQGSTANRDGIGARIKVCANNHTQYLFMNCGEQYLSQNSQWLIAGIGTANRADSVIVEWPGGGRDVFFDLAAGYRHTLIQGQGGTQLNLSYNGATTPCIGDTVFLSVDESEFIRWSIGETSSSIAVTFSDIYFVWVGNGNYTQLSDSFNIHFLEPQSYTLNLEPIGCFGQTGSIQAVAGQPQITSILLNNSPTTLPALNLNAGQYEITISQSGSCDFDTLLSFTQPDSLYATILLGPGSQNPDCPSGIAGTAEVSGGVPPYSYVWNFFPLSGSSPFSTYNTQSFPCTDITEISTLQLLLTDINGCEFFAETTINPASIAKPENEAGLIYPTPCRSNLNVSAKLSNAKVSVFDSAGRLFLQTHIQGNGASLDLSQLASGSYYLRLETPNAVMHRQFSKVE